MTVLRPRRIHASLRRIVAAAASALGVWTAQAASPDLGGVNPTGGQRGTEVEIALTGKRLDDPKEILFYGTGLAAKAVEPAGEKGVKVKAVVVIAPDCPLGEHSFRLRTATGLSDLQTFQVGPYPTVAEAETNDLFEQPQKIAMNVTVEGVVKSEDMDHYAIEARKGERITAVIEGIRLGRAMFDPYVAIIDTNRFELDTSDDTALLLQDSVASVVAPADGTYIVQVRETSFGGGDTFRYRLHVGSFPQPRAVYPAGGRAGEQLDVKYVGDVAGPFDAKLPLPAESQPMPAFATQNKLLAPAPVRMRISPFPNVLETETNDTRDVATSAGQPLPLALNGTIGTAGDRDWFRFEAKKGQNLRLDLFARRLRTPLDSVIAIYGTNGNKIAENDDADGPDSALEFKPPADAAYLVSVSDHLGQGGEAFVYRLEITESKPSLAVNVPIFKKDTQDYQAAPVPRGNRFAILLNAKRDEFGGPLRVQLDDLPPGVKAEIPPIIAGVDQVPILLEAAPDAAPAGRLTRVVASGREGEREIPGDFRHHVELVRGNPNQVTYYKTTVDRLATAVTEEAPFSLELAQPKAPLVQAGVLRLNITAKRKEGFNEAITLKFLNLPSGVTATPDLTLPAGQPSIAYALNGAGDAAVRTSRVAVIGSAKVGGGDLWVATKFVDLRVEPPFFRGKVERTAVERGKPAEVVCSLEQIRPFAGEAKLRLLGLPTKVTTTDKTVKSDSKEAIFSVTTDPESPTGQHKSLFCSLELTIDGETIQHTVTDLGTLRIDPPAKKEIAAAKPVETPKPEPTAETKRLSRLEQLRLEKARKP